MIKVTRMGPMIVLMSDRTSRVECLQFRASTGGFVHSLLDILHQVEVIPDDDDVFYTQEGRNFSHGDALARLQYGSLDLYLLGQGLSVRYNDLSDLKIQLQSVTT